MTDIPVIFSTGSLYPFGLHRVYGWAASTGYDGVEIMMDDRWDTHQTDYLEYLSQSHGIPILALHPPIFEGAWRLGKEETLVRSAKLAHRLQVGVVIAHPPPPGRPLARWAKGALAEARDQGVRVAVENMPRDASSLFGVRRGSCYRPEHLLGLGDVTLDTSHLGASGEDPVRALSLLQDQLRHIHLSDSNFIAGRDEHRLPGKGKLPLREFLSALGQSGYPGAVSLELKPWPLGTPDPEKIQENMRRSLDFVREGLAGS